MLQDATYAPDIQPTVAAPTLTSSREPLEPHTQPRSSSWRGPRGNPWAKVVGPTIRPRFLEKS